MYKLILSPSARKQLKVLKKIFRNAIAVAIEDLKYDPFQGKKLKRDFAGKFVYRIGVYRIVYKVNEKSNIVFILSIGHRSIIYN